MSLRLKFWCETIDVYFVNRFRCFRKIKEHSQILY